MRCPYFIRSWTRNYKPGDFFDAAGYFDQWKAYALLRWIGRDSLYYCDLYRDEDEPEVKTGSAVFTRGQIEEEFDLCGGPTCLAEMAEDRAYDAARYAAVS